jgi:LuxR family transcriptional regulator, activator of conjugal transfer of Ti plasmids
MHRVFQRFIDLLSSAEDTADFSELLSVTSAALDLSSFAYLALPHGPQGEPRLISTYPTSWTSHYLRSNYQSIDPVVKAALQTIEPFRWGANLSSRSFSIAEQQLFDEAAQFGIKFGFTIPIHDGRGPVAALTFASDHRNSPFESSITAQARVLQLMALYFHAHVRRKLNGATNVTRTALSPRENECLEWASQGKSSWEIGRILGISRHTVASYLESAKRKLGVRTVVQAAIRLAAEKAQPQN